MRTRRFRVGLPVAALLSLSALSGFAQETSFKMGWSVDPVTGAQYAVGMGKTDEEGVFRIECPFGYIKEVTGCMKEIVMQTVLPHLPVKILLEPRPGIREILGLGNIGAVWVGLDGFEWTRVTGFGLNWTASGASIDLGEIALIPKLAVTCEETYTDVVIVGEAGEAFMTVVKGTCTTELSFEIDPIKGLAHAKRVTKLPTTVAGAGTWVVVETVEHDQVTRTTFYSDGRVWMEKGTEVLKRVPSLPPTASSSEKFIVKGAGGKEHLYRWWQWDPEAPGKWLHIGEWTMPVGVETPAEEPMEPGEPGGPGMG